MKFVDVAALEAEHAKVKAAEREAEAMAPIIAAPVETEAAKALVPLTYGASVHGIRKPRKEEYINKDPYVNTEKKRFMFNKPAELAKPPTGATLDEPEVLFEKVAGGAFVSRSALAAGDTRSLLAMGRSPSRPVSLEITAVVCRQGWMLGRE